MYMLIWHSHPFIHLLIYIFIEFIICFQASKLPESGTFFFFFGFFLRLHRQQAGIRRLSGLGSNQSWSCWPMPQPWQCGIWIKSATYTTAHGNTTSLTHWVRPGIEPVSSWILVFISAELHGNSWDCLTYWNDNLVNLSWGKIVQCNAHWSEFILA